MKFTRLVCWAFAGLMLAANCAYAQPATTQAVTNDARGNLLRAADAMVKSGKPADAYNLLEPKQGDYSGDVGFEYLLGIAALDSGKADRAAIAFGRVLAVNPNFSGARLDLARAYVAMGSDDIARSEFEIVLTQNPPAQVVEVIKKYIKVIDERQKTKIQQVTAHLETNTGHGNNAATATPDAQEAETQVMTDEALVDLLREADAMLKGGKPADAYNLLEPKEGDYSGDVGFDYLLGIAALDSGKPDRATIAFERVLIVDPNFSGARLDLARAFFAMGSDDLAKSEFEIVLTQSPPEQVKVLVQKYLAVIEERRKAKIQQVTAYLEASVGHDNNVTAATPDFTGGVFGAYSFPGVIATGSALHYAAMYSGLSGGVDLTRLVSEQNGINLFAGVDVKQRTYAGISAMNNLNLDLRAGFSMAKGDNNYRLTGTFGQFRQPGFGTNGNRDTAGLGAEWKRSFGTRDQMAWSVNYSQPRNQMSPTQDTNQTALSASWLHLFEGKFTPLIFANLNRSVDKALQPLVEGGANVDRTGTGVLAHFQFTPLANTDLFLMAGWTIRHDDSPGARSSGLVDFYARDVTRNVNIGVTVRPWTKWSIKGTVAFTNNNSNLSLYQYSRTDSSVSVRRDF